jgi:hypothetical protein
VARSYSSRWFTGSSVYLGLLFACASFELCDEEQFRWRPFSLDPMSGACMKQGRLVHAGVDR